MWRKRKVVPWVPSREFADNIDGCGDDAAIFVVETFPETWPRGTQKLWGLQETFIED